MQCLVNVSADHNDKITMTLFQRNLINANDLQAFNCVPIDIARHVSIQNTLQCVDTNGMLATDILERTVDQLQQHLLFECFCHSGAPRVP
jgi:hypothetical protein